MPWTIVAPTLCAFRTLLDGVPLPAPDSDYTPGPSERFVAFTVCYLMALSLPLLVLPEKWRNTVFEIAFHLKPRNEKGIL